MKTLQRRALTIMIGGFLLVGCASTPIKDLKPSEMIVLKKYVKYEAMKSDEGLEEWEKGLWEYYHNNNYAKAFKLLLPYKDKKDSKVQHALGYMYEMGIKGVVARDLKKAEAYYKRAIEIDEYSYSLHNLAVIYFNGWGSVSKNSNKIIELHEKAAKQGNFMSQYSLGNIYHFGRNGFSEDLGKAYYWYQQASNQGHAKAARRLGYMYERGEGVEKNLEKSLYWHKLAATRGNENSADDVIRIKYWIDKESGKISPSAPHGLTVYSDGRNNNNGGISTSKLSAQMTKSNSSETTTCSLQEAKEKMLSAFAKMQSLMKQGEISMQTLEAFALKNEKIAPLITKDPSKYCTELGKIVQ